MRPSAIQWKRLAGQLQVRLTEEVRHPDDDRPDDRVLVAAVEDLDVKVVRVRADDQEDESLLEHRIGVVILRPKTLEIRQ